MKKILLSAAALLTLLFAASCQKEDFSGADGEFATVTLTVQAPASPVTKAFGDGTSTNLRLDFGVFDENGEVLDALRQTGIEFGAADSEGKRSTTVKVNLAKGKTYHFVCWAQDNSLDCYNHTDLKAITVDYSKNNAANEEKRDAFYACVKSDIVKADYTQTITLTRPFAQLNVGSDDLKEAEKAGLDTTKLYVELSVTNCPNVLNADFAKQSYTVAGSVEATFTKTICPATVEDSERINVELNGTPKSYSWLSMNYIFTSVNKDDLKEVTFKLYEEDTLLDTYTKDNVPFQANWRTNLLGRLLTTDGELTVVIDPNFANVHNIYLDAISQAALQTAIANKVAGTYNVSGYVHAVAAAGPDQETVTLKDDKDDANPTFTRDYTLSVVGLKSDDTFYQAGDYLVVSVTVDADGKDTCAEKHLYHRPAKADDEEVVEPVTPELSLAMDATDPVPADGGKVTVKVTSNVAWTLSLNGSKVAEGSEAVANHTVEVAVPANEQTEEITHTLVLSDVPAEGATAVTKEVSFVQAAAEAVEPEVPAFSAGKYWIMAIEDNVTKVMTPLADNLSYGYGPSADVVDNRSFAINAFTFNEVEGGFTIQDESGKYYYSDATHKSFQLTTDSSNDGLVWSVSVQEDGIYILTNVATERTMKYGDGTFTTFGVYLDTEENTGVYPTLVKADNPLPVELSSISVSGHTTSFIEGDSFKFGGTVTATYTDGSKKDVTEYASVTEPSMADGATVTVSYTEGEVTKTYEYVISVRAADEEVTLVNEILEITASTGSLSADSSSISWTGEYFTCTNVKDQSSTAIRTTDTDHHRFYVGSKLKFSSNDGKTFSKLVLTCRSSYVANTDNVTYPTNVTVSVDGTTVTITFTEAVSEISLDIVKQIRISKVDATLQ